jgi:hypothetical protein
MAPGERNRILKGEPFSVRFTLATDRMIEAEARRTRRSKSAIVEALAIGQLVADTQLSERQVQLALAYRDIVPDEVEDAIAGNCRPVGEWRELYPFVRFVS